MTIEAACERWLHLHAVGKAERTMDSYRGIIRNHISPVLGKYDMDDDKLTLAIADLLSGLIGDGHNRTAELAYVTLRQIAPRAMIDIGRPKHHSREIVAWTNAEISAYMDNLTASGIDTLLLIAITTGLRRGELLGLRWADIDAGAMCIHVQRQRLRTDSGYIISSPKTNAGSRDVPIIPALLAVLETRRGDDEDYICDTTPEKLTRRHHAVCDVANVRHIGLHGLRHSYATAIVRGGGSISGLQRILGHRHYSTTADIYAPPDAAIAVAAAAFFPVPIARVHLTLNQGVQGSSP